MLSEERHQAIAAALRRQGTVTVAALSTDLRVSEATVRRDLDALAEAGSLRRVRGGAAAIRGSVRPEADPRSFEDVAGTATVAKQQIAARACTLIEDGEVIALDIGTTVAAMCPLLVERSLTVVTASLAVVRSLAAAPDIDIVILGGLLRPNYDSMVGTLTESALGQVRVDRAFLGAAGVRTDGAVLDSTPSEVPIKRGLLDVAAAAYLLADHEKFPGSGFLEVARLTRFTALVTDRPPLPFDIALPDGEDVEVLLP
ncbi:DeoR/GlpR family DNA-binding transcription regulator [Brachybacterium saurashtrense]|uniref:Lactose phosphotransferase system repressor n=1 Tax=Brachybacterium saurashtrense TaxID=556288 RepID=A0A345YS25_9MICO|nr:DeoR/GlpR family DNA-binding transcription regulator [Brachybacterium saurashtrense]AXK46727.1 DeoR/GlpR transcriptional regulator [Brachybacterium saurashtrense]RRR22442.1 DeoR/GlpR transcriptional regulator [Brachybacterium saurashtrense]